MIKLSTRRFAVVLFFQCLILVIDLAINSFSYLARDRKSTVIFLFLLQDICLVLAFTVLLFSLYSTYVFQAGLAELLYSKFRTSLIVLGIYFILTLSHHIWIIIDHHKTPNRHDWSTSLTTLFIIQRIFSAFYYYTYKRAALKMSDPRFYENLDWVSEFLAIR
ncbi:transmembrane protein 138 [Contarinia nasturtii]|uniref:transmembrane protein 138 n=1 Tax=Contarinia nasturtii TaxID=265458 RepID=UPI0012D3EAD6|nr:transmembrane protein 138 [Contarinia nasturtii]